MNDQAQDVARRLARTRETIAAASALVEAVRAASDGTLRITDDINVSSVTCALTGSVLLNLQGPLMAAAVAGHRITAVIISSGCELELTWRTVGQPDVQFTGDPGEFVNQRQVDGFAQAVARGDALATLPFVGDNRLSVEIVIKPPEDGASWVRSASLLSERLRDGRWASTLIQFTPNDDGDMTAAISVEDAGSSLLRTPGLIVAGPLAEITTPIPARQSALTEAYRARAARSPRPEMFTPAELVPLSQHVGDLIDLVKPLASCARSAAWYWLADSATVDPSSVIARFDGVSSVELELRPYGDGIPTAEVALAEWATTNGEPSRADAVQQAITFAVRSAADLDGAAGPVLRTARSLHELAGRGLVSEALSARRAARENAVTAARSAANAARDIATKAVERTLTLVIAASAALFANSQKLIDDSTSYVILIVLAVAAAAALTVAIRVDLRSARGILTAFDTDVAVFRDSLSEDDLQSAKDLRALSSARIDLSRARLTAWTIYGAVILAVSVGGSILVSSRDSGAAGGHATTPTAGMSVPSPSPSDG